MQSQKPLETPEADVVASEEGIEVRETLASEAETTGVVAVAKRADLGLIR